MQRKKHSLPIFTALLALLIIAPVSFAEPKAVPTLANILAEFNHYPSAAQKETLLAINKDDANSEATRTIAKAIHNMEHKAKPDDVAELTKILASKSSTDKEKQLASIVIELNHTPSAEARKTLGSLSE